VARRHGLALLADRPRSAEEVLRRDDVIVTVCDSADREVDLTHVHWSIPDPVRVGTARAFESALGEISGRIEDWVGR
jgi:protein-tyrosine-phosphatase